MPARRRGPPVLHLASDIVHLLAAGAWLGGLPALALLLYLGPRSATPNAAAAAAPRRFSAFGVVCVGALLATGMINSWIPAERTARPDATDYGRLSCSKSDCSPPWSACSRQPLSPDAAACGSRGAARAQRNSLAEIVLGLGVLLLVGALGTMEPAGA